MISVIIPIYNTEKYLPKCLGSLAAQTFSDVEFILVDDGSTDNSGAIADQYTDPRFRVFHTGNHGLSAARNFGIEQARGDWLMFVDGDDWVEPGFCGIPYQAAMNGDFEPQRPEHHQHELQPQYQQTDLILKPNHWKQTCENAGKKTGTPFQ